ncbi:MAG: tetratricopeptide repeat protein [Vampirovibrionales bacterium]
MFSSSSPSSFYDADPSSSPTIGRSVSCEGDYTPASEKQAPHTSSSLPKGVAVGVGKSKLRNLQRLFSRHASANSMVQVLEQAWCLLKTPFQSHHLWVKSLVSCQTLLGKQAFKHSVCLAAYLFASHTLLQTLQRKPNLYAQYAEALFQTFQMLKQFEASQVTLESKFEAKHQQSMMQLKEALSSLLLGGLETTMVVPTPESRSVALSTQYAQSLEPLSPMVLARERFIQQLQRCVQLTVETELHPHVHQQLTRYQQEVTQAIETQQVFKALHLLKSLPVEDQYHPAVQTLVCFCLWSLEDFKGMEAILKYLVEHGSQLLQHDMLLCLQRLQQVQLASPLNELEELIELVDTCLQTRQFSAGANYYQRLMHYLPNKEDGLAYLGHLYCQAGQFDQATNTYREAITHRPEDAVAHNNLGVLYLEYHQDFLEAHQLLEQATHLKPDYTMAWFNLGRCYRKLSQAQQAAQCLMKAKALNIQSPEVSSQLIEEHLRSVFSLDD